MRQVNGQYVIHSAHSRPDLWEPMRDPNHPFNTLWPTFLAGHETGKRYLRKLLQYDELAKFQNAVVWQDPAGQETLVAYGQSVPFFWPELDAVDGYAHLASHPKVMKTLPDGGFDTILSRGVEQYLVRKNLPFLRPAFTEDQTDDLATCQCSNPPNALSAIAVVVSPDQRSKGLAEMLIERMKETARKEKLQVLVVPLRPTRKADFPTVSMRDYITWRRDDVPRRENLGADLSASPLQGIKEEGLHLPFDPWLRKHISIGGKIVKVASNSMLVEGSISAWEAWTGVDLQSKRKAGTIDSNFDTGNGYEVCIPGGLAPLTVYPEEDWCVYVEPNLWVYHEL